jgi:endonuclease/exonuclease/phosphatase family metal-dependent hydrolase|tara:strand:- start:1333 stop:1860 length:528 start_codon:yes stop_codon:yes gene_type:complete
LYYPISTNKSNTSEFGNAILSRNQITQENKLILPHKKQNGRIRNATNCVFKINETTILVYYIHMKTTIMSREKRMDQIDSIIKDIKEKEIDHVILGGDFNTLINKDLEIIITKFKEVDIIYNSGNVGATGSYLFGLVKPVNDHFFSRNMEGIMTSKLKTSKSSDHLPILIRYNLN